MRLDKLWWCPHWVFCTFRKNTNMPLTPHGQTTSNDMLSGLCRGIDLNCLCKTEAFWWHTTWLSQAASMGATVGVRKPNAIPELGYLSRHYHQQVGWGD
jgi:hypothetical protein